MAHNNNGFNAMLTPAYETVLFLDGTTSRNTIRYWTGPAITGQATAYVIKNGKWHWIKPGESCTWIESVE